MRTRILAALSTVLSFAPLAALHAQEAEETEAPGGQGETGAAEVVDPPPAAAATPAVQQQPAAGPGAQHTVQPGDTLWDLTQRYMGSPWYWPKVWSHNPEIANPHYIYPGNQVRFFAGGEDVPARVEVATASGRLPSFSDYEDDSSGLLDGLPEDLVTVAGTIGYAGAPTFPVANEGFITQQEVDASGEIEAAFTFGFFVSEGETVYVRFKNRADARVGDRYTIFRTEEQITHPVTGRSVGYLTQNTGLLEVTDVSGDKLVTARIVKARDDISRGDRVGPAGEQDLTRIVPRPNEVALEGYLLTAMVPYLNVLGEMQRVFVDKGSADGVQPGNTFTFVRQQDHLREFMNPAQGQDEQIPVQEIGTCIVLDVREHVSSCLITRSLIDLTPGDRAVMKAETSTTAQR